MICLKKIPLILVALAGSYSYAQAPKEKFNENKYRAVHWTIYDGLSNGFNDEILKDANGFLWIGSMNGLNRFDGNLFKNYYHDPHDKLTIAGNEINGIKEDSLHNIWIGTDRGLSRFDIKADTFKNFFSAKKTGPDLPIVPFWATRDKLYAFEPGIITDYDIHSFKKTTLVNLKKTDSIATTQYTIFDQASDSIWLLNGLGDAAGGGLLNISLADGKRRKYDWLCYRNIQNHCHASEQMRYDPKRNAIWINSPDGLMEFTLGNKQFHHIDGTNDLAKSKNQVGIDIDTRGRIWLATDQKGILIYDPLNGSLTIPFPNDPVLQHNISNANKIIYCDRDGITWCGTWTNNGLYQLLPFSPAVKLYTPHDHVFSIANAGGGKLWVGTGNGLYIFNKQKGELNALNKKDFPGLKFKGFIVPDFTDPGLNQATFVTDAGSFMVDMKTQMCRPIIFKDSVGKPLPLVLRFMLPFKNSWLFMGTYNDKELFFTGSYGTVAPVAIPVTNNTIQANQVLYTSTDDEHLIFIKQDETRNNVTLSYVNGKLLRIKHPMDSVQWTSIFFNKKDRSYWVAAESKLIHYNSDFKAIRTYGVADGLPDMEILGLIADNNGNIWFHTDRSIHQLNVETGEITMLTEKDGFEKQSFLFVLPKYNYKDNDGDIYYPGGGFGSGFDRITPGKYTNPPSSIYLQSLEVDQKPYPLTTGINNLAELSLRYNENKITIETGIIDYYSKGTSHMRYKLQSEGKNENWQYGPANYTIRFEGLQPGKYTLRMQASNAAFQFNGAEKILNIIIRPPWWQTWWAWVLYVAVFGTSIYAFVAYRSRTLIREKHVLEKNVAIRTQQLSEANKELNEKTEEITSQRDQLSDAITDLKATQKQLIQSEKMASLGELTAGIAHEIQNPLNFVNNFSDVSRELIVEMKEEIDKGDINEVRLLVADIEQNLEKINHHGKRADAIVKGMLEHSRTNSGHKELTDINALADEYLRLAYHGLRAKDKTFHAHLNTDFDDSINKMNIIAQDIGRVFLNLFNNAFYAVTEKAKTAQAGYHPTVTLSTKKIENWVLIIVSDNGNGIPQKIIDKVFQPFFTTKPTGQGTGLGLSLSYDIIKAHGGEIKIETEEGEGTKFIISIPA